eukprot:2953867-Prymnesium_polylepis.1
MCSNSRTAGSTDNPITNAIAITLHPNDVRKIDDGPRPALEPHRSGRRSALSTTASTPRWPTALNESPGTNRSALRSRHRRLER